MLAGDPRRGRGAVGETRRDSDHNVSPDQYKISKREQWRSFFLWGFGDRVAANCTRSPQTTWALECVPGLTTVFFSGARDAYSTPSRRLETPHKLSSCLDRPPTGAARHGRLPDRRGR
ncbi:MAG: hypothetical protein E6Q98_06015 [Rhodospirillaceae bacterium]|nr:MAG: hypothetical protein E6Q98_06015 [Rhodospirillaceae bacterium]